MNNNVLLIGFMGAGKSSVGKLLSEKLEQRFIDIDEEIERGEEKTIKEIFDEEGEARFRELETKYLKKMLNKKNKIIATGGGVISKEENIELLKRIGTVVFLHTPYEQILKNLEGDQTRPLFQDNDYEGYAKNLLQQREPIYFNTANILIQTKDKTLEEITEEIIGLL